MLWRRRERLGIAELVCDGRVKLDGRGYRRFVGWNDAEPAPNGREWMAWVSQKVDECKKT
jgi:hypothetical protein